MNILVLAYACEPLKGSEPGVGWNLSVALAEKHNVTVLTRRNNKECISEYLKSHPVNNLQFIFHDLPSWMMNAKKIIGTQAYYILWNLTAKSVVKKYLKNKHVDVVHHLTFNQYRTPSIGYIIEKPFVVGPIGGAELIDPVFDCELETDTLKRENFRRSGKDYKIFSWLSNRSKARKAFVFSAKENVIRLNKYINKNRDIVRVLPSIAIDKNDFDIEAFAKDKKSPFTMIYAGRALDWKGLHVFLMALAQCANKLVNAKTLLIGIRTEEERTKVNRWLDEYGLKNCVELINFMPRPELIKRLREADLFVYPAFRDSGSMAVLEACALGCPSIVFDAGGQDAFPDDTIVKVALGKSFEDTLNNFAEKLIWAYTNRGEIAIYGKKAQNFAFSEMTWRRKAEQFDIIYNELLKDTK